MNINNAEMKGTVSAKEIQKKEKLIQDVLIRRFLSYMQNLSRIWK